MSDYEDKIPEMSEEPAPQEQTEPRAPSCQCKYDVDAIKSLEEKLLGLQDLFLRRLNDDRQKTSMIKTLEDGASFAFVEPFISDLILLLDRLDKSDDDFVLSVKEELLDILERRGVKKIQPTQRFDPAVHKAVKVVLDPEVQSMTVTAVMRNGYTFSGRVIRPVEVVIAKPADKPREVPHD